MFSLNVHRGLFENQVYIPTAVWSILNSLVTTLHILSSLLELTDLSNLLYLVQTLP